MSNSIFEINCDLRHLPRLAPPAAAHYCALAGVNKCFKLDSLFVFAATWSLKSF